MDKIYNIIFLIAHTVYGGTVNACPTLCSCWDTNVYCHTRSRTTVPSNIPNSTILLYLNRNKITRIDEHSFHGLSVLTQLNLSYNQIQMLKGTVFKDLTALIRLNLDNNLISSLDSNLFRGLSSLETLCLDHNKIRTLDGNLFKGLTNLNRLHLYANQITTLHGNIFQGLTALRELYIQGNQIISLYANIFQGLTSLTELDLSKNKITTLHSYLFRGLTDLIYLWLNGNQITSIDSNLFQGLESLKELSLQKNRIAKLDVDIFQDMIDLHYLYLENNTLDCSKCELKKFKEFLLKDRFLIVSGASCEDRQLIDHNFINCTESETTEALQSSAATDYPATERKAGMIQTQHIIYLSCGVGLIIILSCSMASFYVGKKYQTAQNLERNQIIDINNRDEVESELQINPNMSTSRGSGHDYAEIDELEMSDFILSPPEQVNLINNDNSSESSDGIRLPTDGYLNPYQSLIPTLLQSRNNDEDSDGYCCNAEEENKAYTNLYQPLRFNQHNEVRQYSSCTSVQYFDVIDEPIVTETDLNINKYKTCLRKTW